jgi:hypothetical protein
VSEGLRAIAEQLAQEWWSFPSTDIVAVVLERAMRLAIEKTHDWTCLFSSCKMDKSARRNHIDRLAVNVAESLKAEVGK